MQIHTGMFLGDVDMDKRHILPEHNVCECMSLCACMSLSIHVCEIMCVNVYV